MISYAIGLGTFASEHTKSVANIIKFLITCIIFPSFFRSEAQKVWLQHRKMTNFTAFVAIIYTVYGKKQYLCTINKSTVSLQTAPV